MLKETLEMDGFLKKWHQWIAFMEREKIVASIVPLAIAWWLVGDEGQEKEQDTLDCLSHISTRRVARRVKNEDGFPYIENEGGSHNLFNF